MLSRSSIVIVWVSVLLLLGIGVVMITSTSVWIESEANEYDLLTKQVVFGVVGILAALLGVVFDYRLLKKRWIVVGAFVFCLVLLAMCYLPSEAIAPRLNGEKRWLRIAGLQFQPSEIAKLVTMMAIAAWFAAWPAERIRGKSQTWLAGTRWFCGTWYRVVMPGFLFGLPVLLIFFEKDMGTAVAFSIAGCFTMLVAGMGRWYLLGSAIIGITVMAYAIGNNEHRMERIEAWQNLEASKQGLGLQQWRAQLALANGNVTGVGLGHGAEKHGYLPFAHTDFIFATIGEEFGVTGSLVVIVAFSVLTFGGIGVAMNCQDPFGRVLAFGITSMIFIPAMLNIYVVTALLPNTGLPLPFISAGGMNLLFSLAGIGILTSIHFHEAPNRIRCVPRNRRKGAVDLTPCR